MRHALLAGLGICLVATAGWAGNQSFVGQSGIDNEQITAQTGRSRAVTLQRGTGNRAVTVQDGVRNLAVTVQSGQGHAATTAQNGNNQISSIVQVSAPGMQALQVRSHIGAHISGTTVLEVTEE